MSHFGKFRFGLMEEEFCSSSIFYSPLYCSKYMPFLNSTHSFYYNLFSLYFGGNQQEFMRPSTNMKIKTFTHDYYLLTLPTSLDSQFYREFPDYAEKFDFRGNHISVAPVARIYGTNEFGQKCCCHIHGFFPFFYIKTDEFSQAFKKKEHFMQNFLQLLEELFKRAYSINQSIIVGGAVEEKMDFYGYHEKPQTFLKITVYDPGHIFKLRQLLDSKIVHGRSFQCYEAHINYHMQLFTEYNIFGIHEMKIDGFTFRKNMDKDLMQLFKKIDSQFNGKIMEGGWNIIHQQERNPDLFNSLHKGSTCYIEIDVPIQSILNPYVLDLEIEQQERASLDSSNSQKIKQPMVPNQHFFKVQITKALEEVWLDERRRRQNHSINEPLVGIIDYTQNLEGNSEVVNGKKDPLWINFINKGKSKDGCGRIIDDVILMIKSAKQAKPPEQKFEIKQSREVVENYNGVLFAQREELIEKVKERWRFYGERKVNMIQQIMMGERGELPEWDDESSSENQQNEEKHEIGNTFLYRNNYKHTKATLKKRSFFEICEYCRKKSQNCLCSDQMQSQSKLTKKFKTLTIKCENQVLSYKPIPPNRVQALEGCNATYQKPYYSNFRDLFIYNKINSIFKINLKNAQILAREIKSLKQYNRQPITIRNDLKLPSYFQIFQKPESKKIIPKSYCLQYQPLPPPYNHQSDELPGQLRLRKSASVAMAKEETFISDLMIFQYEFITQIKEDHNFMSNPEEHPIICVVYSLVNFKDYGHNIKGLIIVEEYTPKERNQNISYNSFLDEFDDIFVVEDERSLLYFLTLFIFRIDPDLLVTYDQEKRGIRYLAQRGFELGINIPMLFSRCCSLEEIFQYINFRDFYCLKETYIKRQVLIQGNILQGPKKTHNSSQLKFLQKKMKENIKKKPVLRKKYKFQVNVQGRVNLNLLRICEQDSKQRSYTLEAMNKYLFDEQLCEFTDSQIYKLVKNQNDSIWAFQYLNKRIKVQSKIIIRLNIISGIIEKSKIYGADFVSMMERGSQFKIQSVMCRVTKKNGYLTLSASKRQVANQSILECQPLVIEPPKQFFSQPVLLFDFQSLYPSVMIAYNLCYSTCLGSVNNLFSKDKTKKVGVSENLTLTTEWLEEIITNYDQQEAKRLLEQYIFVTPNKVAFVKKTIKEGLIPRILLEFLISRMMIKKSIPLYSKSRIKSMLKEREISLKLFMNVMFGYTGASFSGRMPCSEIADSVVQISKYCLKKCIDFLTEHPKYRGTVLYGDTDSIFFHVPTLTIQEAIRAGKQLQEQMTKLFPYPMKMKFQKVYDGLFLVAKKRYYGKFYQDENSPAKYEGKGLECVRRDGIELTSAVMKEMLNDLIEKRDLSSLKKIFRDHYSELLGGFKQENEIYLAKQVKMIKYTEKSIPAHGEAARRLQKLDPMLLPRYGERMKYFITKSNLKSLKSRSLSVFEYVMKNMSIDWQYYAEKQFLPPLARALTSLINLKDWVPLEIAYNPENTKQINAFSKKKCLKCKQNAKLILCDECLFETKSEMERIEKLKKDSRQVCLECVGNHKLNIQKCVEWNCPQFFRRRKSDKLYDATYPELEKIHQAIQALQF